MESNNITHKKGVYNELPISFKYKDLEVSNFTARELTLKEIKSLGKPEYKANNPFKWIAKACCLSIEEIAGVPVYEQYKSSQKFPEVITKIPLINTNNILVAGHIKTLGEHVETLPSKCRSCGNESESEIDLLTLDVPYLSKSFEEYIFTVELRKGFDIGSKYSEELGIPRTYTQITFRLPTLGDLMRLERDMVSGKEGLSEFFEKILQKCIVSMEDENGNSLPENILSLKRDIVLNNIHPYDWKKIRKEYNNNTPQLSLQAISPCENCGAELEFEIDQSFLFQ